MLKTVLPMQGVQVRSLVGELNPTGSAVQPEKKRKKKTNLFLNQNKNSNKFDVWVSISENHQIRHQGK